MDSCSGESEDQDSDSADGLPEFCGCIELAASLEASRRKGSAD